MDGLKLSLSNGYVKNVVTKLLSKVIYKKLGYKIDIQLNDIEITTADGAVHIHADINGYVDKDEFKKIVKSVGLD